MSSGPSIQDPNLAAIAGIQQQAQDYPYSYLVDALAQTGGSGTLTNPANGESQNLDFTGLGTADVQNKVSAQMAQVLLNIQQNYGSQFIAQQLADLKRSDPTGYAAYGQLFDSIQKEASQSPPDAPLAAATQDAIKNALAGSQSLTPQELRETQQDVRGNELSKGVFLGNAPAQAEAGAVLQATDQKNANAQGAASQYLSEGVTPSDLAFRSLQQNLRNYGSFINGETPTAEFSSISGAQNGAAPNPSTGYQTPTLNPGAGAESGINQANQLFGINSSAANSQVNPYLAGLNLGAKGLGVAASLGWNPWSTSTTSNPASVIGSQTNLNNAALGIGNLSGSPFGSTDVPALSTADAPLA